jgi:hypothetical protein
MSLRIDITNARPLYHPGDLIAGNVTLDSKKSEDIAQVFIDFTGRCKVKIRRHDHYTTVSATNFEIELTLDIPNIHINQ